MSESTATAGTPLSDRPDLRKHFPLGSADAWQNAATAELKDTPIEKLTWQTLEGIAIKPIYSAPDLNGLPNANGLPGFPPFARGTQPLAGVRPPWQVRQDCALPTPEEANTALRDGLARGATAVGLRLDNAARQGYDGDSLGAIELVGAGGCTVSSIFGLRMALADIDLANVPISIRSGTASLPVLAMLVAIADEQQVPRKRLTGSVEGDPLRELVKFGTLRGSLAMHQRELVDMAVFCKRECPGIRPIMVNSHTWHNAGASITQELAFTLATAAEYHRLLTANGFSADEASWAMSFSFSISTNIFPEIAKLRAARILWAQITGALGATQDGRGAFIHAKTSTFTKTIHDPWTNALRTTFEAFAATVGGCDSLFVAPYDEAIGRPDEAGARLARNQQLILREEGGIGKVVDPAGGSYYIEGLTDAIAREAWTLFQKIEGAGGFLNAVAAGVPQAAVAETSARRTSLLTSRRQAIVGVSSHPNPLEKVPTKSYVSQENFLQERQRRISRLKLVRDNNRVRSLLSSMTRAIVAEEGNLMDIAVNAAREGTTIGEMIKALYSADSGIAPVVTALGAKRFAVPFEDLRNRMTRHASKFGVPLKVLLLPMGAASMRRARIDFAIGFYGAGGYEVVTAPVAKTNAEALASIEKAKPAVVVYCADDPSYPAMADTITAAAKKALPGLVVHVAGLPKDDVAKLEAAGVDGFIHVRANVVETLSKLHDKLGVSL